MKNLPVLVISLGILVSLTGIFSLYLQNKPHLTTQNITLEPLKSSGVTPPEVSATHILIKDLTTGQILYEKDADTPVSPASTTKMMTALVAVRDYGWDKEIIVDKSFKEGSIAGFKPGEKYTVEQLVYTLLLKSANDAAEVLAEAHPGGRAGFVGDMNLLSRELGLSSTQFQNPSGLDEDNHISTATDLTRLGEYLVDLPVFSRIVSTQTASILDSSSGSGKILANSNPLLGKVPGVLGIKTGFTDNSGQSLISLVNRGDRRIIITILGSSDREKDSSELIEWVYQNFTWLL